MRKFIKNIFIFSFIVLSIVLFVFSKADGKSDPFYLRFTTPKQTSLVIGTSRAAQGILPHIINKELNRSDLYNYSFTLGHSPFGRTYLNSIKSKLESNTKDGLFILAVDPWSISSVTEDPNDSLNFRERSRSLAKTKFVSLNPNVEYLIESYDKSYFNFFEKSDKMKLHKNGWLEISINMSPLETKKRTDKKILVYRNNNLSYYQFSEVRYNLLDETVKFLKSHGDVYLVRLPISPSMQKIEDILDKNFDNRMEEIASDNGLNYFNFTSLNEDFLYTDGNHLYKNSGVKVSELIAEEIKKTECDKSCKN